MKFSAARAALLSLCLFMGGMSLAHADALININTADADAMAETLSGVGTTRAQAIVEFREANGQFESVDDLLNVTGIGPATVDVNRDRIVLE